MEQVPGCPSRRTCWIAGSHCQTVTGADAGWLRRAWLRLAYALQDAGNLLAASESRVL
jgi:hypothetical protein